MHSLRLLATASAAFVVSAVIPEGYSTTPIGYMRSDCVHTVPNGAHIQLTEEGAVVTHPSGSLVRLPKCNTADGRPMLFRQQNDQSRNSFRRQLQFPADYKGWLEYANVTSPDMTTGFSAFTSVFSVPTQPSSPPDVLYLFPGLQNIDWVPLVDPLPTQPFDIIQPVLQYPGDLGNYWSVKSWWVTLDVGAMASTEVSVKEGDQIFGNMTKTGNEMWFIDSVDLGNGQSTSITASGIGSRLKSQPWGYITLECYGCSSCATYPAGNSSCAFSDMLLTPVGSNQPITTPWQANPKPSKHHFCHESIQLINSTNANIYFDNTA